MTLTILTPMVERWRCLDWWVANLRLLEIPTEFESATAVLRVQASLQYYAAVQRRIDLLPMRAQSYRVEPAALLIDAPEKSLQANRSRIVGEAYRDLLQHVPRTTHYLFIEDDTLYPTWALREYLRVMQEQDAVAVSGVSYARAAPGENMMRERPFWTYTRVRTFPEGDSAGEISVNVRFIKPAETGIVKLGGTGVGFALVTREALNSWNLDEAIRLGRGPDIQFWLDLEDANLPAYGIWDVRLPHVHQDPRGIVIMGRIDPTILRVLGASEEAVEELRRGAHPDTRANV